MQRKTIIALIIICIISIVTTLLFATNTTLSYLRWLIGTTIIQFLIQYIITLTLDAKLGIQIKKIEQENIRMIMKNEQEVICPCHLKNIQVVGLQFDEPVFYKCDKCKRDLVARVDVSSALATIPIPSSELDNTLEKIKNKISDEHIEPISG